MYSCNAMYEMYHWTLEIIKGHVIRFKYSVPVLVKPSGFRMSSQCILKHKNTSHLFSSRSLPFVAPAIIISLQRGSKRRCCICCRSAPALTLHLQRSLQGAELPDTEPCRSRPWVGTEERDSYKKSFWLFPSDTFSYLGDRITPSCLPSAAISCKPLWQKIAATGPSPWFSTGKEKKKRRWGSAWCQIFSDQQLERNG